jgi:hypothetical protein
MRYLHSVGIHERFVASGIYAGIREREPTGESIVWSIHELPDGAHFIRLDWQAAESQGWYQLMEAWRSPESEGGNIERLDVQAFAPHHTITHVRATYTLLDDGLEVGRTLDGGSRLQESLPLPERAYFMLPPAFFPREIVRQSTHKEGRVHFIVPTASFDDATAFSAVVQQLGFRCVEAGTREVGGGVYHARCFQPTHPYVYPDHEIWVDDCGVLLFQQMTDESGHKAGLTLTQYARRPEPKQNI